MNDRRFSGEIDRLRASERVARLEVDRVVDLIMNGMQTHSLLDVGTGSGLFAEAFAARGLKVTGVDLREDMLVAARHYVPGGDFRLAHMESLPFADAAFDLVFLGLVLHEADDIQQALSEARRVAARRVAILEWPYQIEDYGPPLEHRLTPEQISNPASEPGFSLVYLALSHLSLYILDKSTGGQG